MITKKKEKKKSDEYLQSPSGIISKRLCAAENTSKPTILPIPDGIPSKSSWFSFTIKRRRLSSLQICEGRAVSLLRHMLSTSSLGHFSVINVWQSINTTNFQKLKLWLLHWKDMVD